MLQHLHLDSVFRVYFWLVGEGGTTNEASNSHESMILRFYQLLLFFQGSRRVATSEDTCPEKPTLFVGTGERDNDRRDLNSTYNELLNRQSVK